jgi:uncharacterized protein YecE (DUF72 family)
MYADWEGIVYPPPRRGFDRLALMASLFDTNEINSTFYRIPPPTMTTDWARRVAHNPKFVFSAKLFRGFTHERNATAEDAKAVRAAMEPLAEAGRLGCLLVQVPMSFHSTPENRDVLGRIFATFSAFPRVVEFRHDSWDSPDIVRFLEDAGVGFASIDQPRMKGNMPATAHVTGPVAYYRFHGRNAEKWFGTDTSNEERYDYLYSKRELEPWVERIREGAGRRPDANAFAILNNHFRGQAVANALELQHLLTGEIREAPESLREAHPDDARVTVPLKAAGQRKLFENPPTT